MNESKFWIRQDRMKYFMAGLIVTLTIAGFISAQWKFSDRTEVRQNIKMRPRTTPGKQQGKLKEVQYTPAKLRVGDKQYYRMDGDKKPSMPKMGETND